MISSNCENICTEDKLKSSEVIGDDKFIDIKNKKNSLSSKKNYFFKEEKLIKKLIFKKEFQPALEKIDKIISISPKCDIEIENIYFLRIICLYELLISTEYYSKITKEIKQYIDEYIFYFSEKVMDYKIKKCKKIINIVNEFYVKKRIELSNQYFRDGDYIACINICNELVKFIKLDIDNDNQSKNFLKKIEKIIKSCLIKMKFYNDASQFKLVE